MTPIKTTFAFGAVATDPTNPNQIARENGIISLITLVVPNFTNNVTATLTIKDEDNVEIYNSGAKARNATYVLTGLVIPVDHGYKINVTVSGAAGGAGGSVVAKSFVENRR